MDYLTDDDLLRIIKSFDLFAPTPSYDRIQSKNRISIDVKTNLQQLLSKNVSSAYHQNQDDTEELYIGNLPYEATPSEIKAKLESLFGKVSSINLKVGATGQSKGFGFVSFSSKESENAALTAGQISLRERKVKIDRSKSNKKKKKKLKGDSIKISVNVGLGNWLNGFGNSALLVGGILGCDISISINERILILSIPLLESRTCYKMVFDFTSFMNTKIVEDDDTFCLTMWRPPRLYYQEEETGIRVCDFTHPKIVGESNLYMFVISLESLHDKKEFFQILENTNIQFVTRKLKKCIDMNPDTEPLSFPDELDWRTRWYLECLVTHRILFRKHLTTEFLKHLANEDDAIVIPTLSRLLIRYRSKRSSKQLASFHQELDTDSLQAIKDKLTFTKQKKFELPRDPPADCAYIARVYVTPTTIYCLHPELEVSNRIIRKYKDHINHFIRVSFVDENFKKISHTDAPYATIVNDRFLNVMKNGMNIGGRHFEFLMYSSSSLREHTTWFYSPIDGLSAENIRSQLGRINETIPAKFGARLGQALSSTRPALQLHKHMWKEEDDIRDETGKYIFSDGIGRISPRLVKEINDKLDTDACGFQIRCAGYKGMLVIDPNLANCNTEVVFRRSMRKYDPISDVIDLEVVRPVSYMPSYLNRQIILLLETRGVPKERFLDLQRSMVEKLDKMASNREVAIRFLKLLHMGTRIGKEIVCVLDAGFRMKDPYIQGIISAFRAQHTQELKEKARIQLTNGFCLMGVLDETGTLKYGQVFIQCRDPLSETYSVLKQSQILVAKPPCLYPGDILILEAVDHPALYHYRNVIVFPSKGPRPHPNETSGGDLDGDIFFVSAEPSIIPQQNAKPDDYEPPKSSQEDIEGSMINGVIRFFGKYIQNDNLGKITNAHMALAHNSTQLANDSSCIELARQCTIAVDFPKSGVPAKFDYKLIPQEYPHFMSHRRKTHFHSAGAIGTLYDELQNMEAPSTKYPEQVRLDDHLIVPGHEEFLEEAIELLASYTDALQSIMEKYKIHNEAVAISGALLKVPKYLKKDQHDARSLLRKDVDKLRKDYKKLFNKESLTAEERLRKASAWYVACYMTFNETPDDEDYYRFLSFPWIVWKYLPNPNHIM